MFLFGMGLEIEQSTNRTLSSPEVKVTSKAGLLQMPADNHWRFAIPHSKWDCRIQSKLMDSSPRPYTWFSVQCRAADAQAAVRGICAKYVEDVPERASDVVATMDLLDRSGSHAEVDLICRTK
jgi:hypothetical protein